MQNVTLSHRRAKPRLESSIAARANRLWLGFGALLLLMAFVAFDANRTIQSLETSSTNLRHEAHIRDALLDNLREGLDRSATVARDYLLEPDRDRAAALGNEMQDVRARSQRALAEYEQLLPANERGAFRALKSDAAGYWRSLDPILAWRPTEREQKMDDYLLEVVLPRGGEAVRLAKLVAAVNAHDLDQAEQRLRSLQSGFRQRIMLVSAIAIIIGLIVAVVSTRHMRHLEAEAEARYREAAETRQELRKLADRLVVTQEEERRRISRELHDEVGQSMSAMLVDLGSVESALPPDTPNRLRLTIARELAESSVRAIRDIALLLRPSMLDDLGLTPALNWQAREVNRRTGLKVKMAADELGEDLPDAHRTCVYRVVQEALQNCVKHSGATQAKVSAHCDGEGLSLSIQDNGSGFDPIRQKGAGLLGMEERVRVLGGRFRVDSRSGEGTLISIRLPLRATFAPPTHREEPAKQTI